MDLNFWIWMFLIVFMLHNFEEILTIENWFRRTYPRIKHKIPSFAVKVLESKKDTSAGQFSMAVFVLFIIVSAIITVVTSTSNLHSLFLGANVFFALNIFTHPLQALYLKRYVPGLWSSVLVIIPYNIILFYHFSNENLLTYENILSTFIVAILFIPLLFISHKVADKWKVNNY